MDEYTADAFANRDEPISLIAVGQSDLEASSSEADIKRRRQKIKRSPSSPRLKTDGQDLATTQLNENESNSAHKVSLQDRLFSKLLQQVFPTEDVSDEFDSTTPVDRLSSKYVSRPGFSLPLMTNNFRRFNARIGIVFVFQNRLIRLFTWRTPSHTLSFLATYTFVCLDPYLLVVVPLAVALLFVMVPAFTSRHPPPPRQAAAPRIPPDYYQAYTGPAIAPAATIKPARETSKDFFRNMRDLQNSMGDFSNVHDALVSTIAPATNFSNETFSSQLFLYLTILTTLSFITAHLLPWRLIFLLGGWTAVIFGHPAAQVWLMQVRKQAEKQASLTLNDPTLKHRQYIHGIPLPVTPAAIQSTFASFSEIALSTTPETREVEIFELQHRPLTSITSGASGAAAEWQPHLFTPTPYDPLSPARIAGDRPRGTRFFEDVVPPEGWEWANKKWELDLEAGEWVNERLVVGVEYDVLHQDLDDADERGNSSGLRRTSTSRLESVNVGFGGWVWDLPPAPGSGANRDDDLWLAYGDYDVPGIGTRDDEKRKQKKEKDRSRKPKDWEETAKLEHRGRTGEWRRRRWVRLVKRKVVEVR
ncbi:uncharacterized protein Z518_06389 [Rhinocladiella mackenziei CBS 650.93]|uniref:TECPR1-like DysF domain-containing protein n=1 Tax=Rhinocladiella mackenziei CBS 650.93 TaxID=1442369 RepID=A0A0D2FTX2_9EURO|nr:uncharacterized protein Z518_06389 [Rhinocladiella mackenziei CBS 650.93]KIX05517.1 hypothetical protein Z518_06389 [Rhinocladiella mackenziei CBS 650.93]